MRRFNCDEVENVKSIKSDLDQPGSTAEFSLSLCSVLVPIKAISWSEYSLDVHERV